jgi:hypothetical protein
LALSAFEDEGHPPSEPSLAAILGRTSNLWPQLRDELQAAHGPLTEDWNYSGKAFGWSFRLKQKKRVIVYMTPCRGHFLASFALGEKAAIAARQVGLSPALTAILDASPKYAEGRGVRIPVRTQQDVAGVQVLVAAKVAN